MTEKSRTEISLSKTKLAKLIVFSILFLVAGIWMIVKQQQTSNALFNNPIIKGLAAYGGTLMGLLGIYFFSKKLLDKMPGIIVDEYGITDNTSAFSFGLIPWSDIAEINEHSIQTSINSRQKSISIGLKNPESYIARETNAIKRTLLKLNAKNYGSPVHISTNGLKINHTDLLKLIDDAFNQFK